jgi:hypothetical protein
MLFPLAFGFVTSLPGLSTLFVNSLIRSSFDRQGLLSADPRPDQISIAELGRQFLFRGSNNIYGIPAVIDPSTQSSSIPQSHKTAINSIVRRLRLFGQIEIKDVTPPPDGSVILLGGPVANYYSRLVLGQGFGSPLLSLVGAQDSLPVVFHLGYQPTDLGRPTKKSDWHLVVQGKLISEPQEFLLIHSMPNPYSLTPERLVVIGGRHGHGTEAIDFVLRDARLLEKLARQTNDLPAWQALIPVTVGDQGPTSVGDCTIFELSYDFARLGKLLETTPFLSDSEQTAFVPAWPATSGLQPEVAKQSFNRLESTLSNGAARTGSSSGSAPAVPPTADTSMSKPDRASELLKDLPEWVRQRLSAEGVQRAAARTRHLGRTATVQMPDFNETPLNGEHPSDIRERFGVEVRILRANGPTTGTHSIFVSGQDEQVQRYLDHLTSTWRLST